MRNLVRALLLIAFTLIGSRAPASERIFSFDADISVRADAGLEVVETIRVNAEGSEIRRGIFRDIPLRRPAPSGLWDKNGFKLRFVRHNGAESPYKTEWQGNFLRIYIGDKDVLIPSGEHLYEIGYATTGQLRFFADKDELYWNVTGNFWSFPIETVSATVRFPDSANTLGETGYTGTFGATDRGAYRSNGIGRQEIRFETTQALQAQEGFTLAVGFTNGVVAQNASSTILTNLAANSGAILFAIGWLFVPFYYLWVWLRVGRDPPGETLIPLFHPPENLSPSAMSFVHFKSFRQAGRGASLAFIAALLALGVRKMLVIDEDDKGAVTFRRGNAQGVTMESLPPGERTLYSRLLLSQDSISLSTANGPLLQKAHEALQSTIRSEYAGKFYRHNLGWFVAGPVVAIAAFVGGLILQDPPEIAFAAVMPAFFGSIFGGAQVFFGLRSWTGPSRSMFRRAAALVMMASGLIVLGAILWGIVAVPIAPAFRFGALLVMAGCLTIAAMAHLIGAPTFEGAKVLSRIEGFKLYLTTAETNRMNMRDAPQMNEELFERYLPYAAGLGVEEPWSGAFSAHLARVAPLQQRDQNYHPGWYRGRDFDLGSLARATGASVAAVSAAMASSMPAPKSSSGSGGGGFSGGGGGGGGGGGW